MTGVRVHIATGRQLPETSGWERKKSCSRRPTPNSLLSRRFSNLAALTTKTRLKANNNFSRLKPTILSTNQITSAGVEGVLLAPG